MSWFYVQDGQRVGPVTEQELQAKAREGVVSARTWVWREGMADWRPLGELSAPGLASSPRIGGPGVGTLCVECGQAFAREDVVELAGGLVCAACKPIRLQRIREGAPVEGPCTAYADGKHLLVLRHGELPRRCVCCNAPASAVIRRKFYWYPPWVNLLIIPGLLFALIAVFILQRQMTLELPLCAAHQRRRRWRILGCIAWAMGSIGACPMFASLGGGLGIAMGVFAMVSFLVPLALGQSFSSVLRPRRITDEAGRFSGASAEFLGSLPGWPGGGRV